MMMSSNPLSLFFPVPLLPLTTESAYDLLPPELQLPFSSQQDLKIMSQKSGGEAGPPPSALLVSGASLLLLC